MSTKKLQILGEFGEKIYKQNDEPIDAPDGSLWVDLDAESGSGGNNSEGNFMIQLDQTLSVEGMAADAKAVGDALETKQPVGNYATESFVTNKIAEAQLGGGDDTPTIDLSGYATKDDLNAIDFPVDSVNGQTGVVQLDADDLGALNLQHITDNEHIVPSGADLNTYTTPGAYRIATASIAASLVNAPPYTVSGFRLIVSGMSGTAGVVQFAIFNHVSNPMWSRVQNNGGNWGEWNQFFHTGNQPTADDVGALNMRHITDDEHLVPNGADLNSYTTPGAYRIESQEISQSLVNAPAYSNTGGRLIVSGLSTSVGIIQFIVYSSSNNLMWFRVRNHEGVWGKWDKFFTSEDVVSIKNGGTEATNADDARANLNAAIAPKELWSGSWESGTLTVADTDKYNLFMLWMSGSGTSILAVKHGTHIRGIGGYSSAAKSIIYYQFAATVSGNTWTHVACNAMNHLPGSAHGELSESITISAVYGLC